MKHIILIVTFCLMGLAGTAQKIALTEKDYMQAEKFLASNTQQYVDHAFGRANWLAGNRFWYRILTPTGSEFILVDASRGTRTAAFDHAKMAAALAGSTGKQYEASKLPFRTLSFTNDGRSVQVQVNSKNLVVDLKNYTVTTDTAFALKGRASQGMRAPGNEVASPDGSKAAFIKDYNLWYRDTKTNREVQLTKDGIKDYGYATDNAGWKHSDAPILRWSKNSKKIATFRQDQRKVGDMYLVSTNVGHPNLLSWKYPLPGDKEIAMLERVIIDIESANVTLLKIAPDAHRGTLSDDIASSGTFDDNDWNEDASQLAFVSTSRDHKHEKFRIADAATGVVREVFEEKVSTQFESGQDAINWRYLSKSNEIIWYSERDNWGHLYLYNALTGKVKNQITKGEWLVTQLLKVDEKNRVLYFLTAGLQKENPYFIQLYKTGFDGKNLTLLSPGEGNHNITFSPNENYFIDTYSKPNVAPVSVLRNLDGKLITTLEKTDISRLAATGWKPPTPITVIANDGKTDIYGLMFTPTNIDPEKKYPVINYIYPGPQGGSVSSWSFAASRGDHQALAELGFIVVLIEGTSNPLRSKSYHDAYYPNMAQNTLPDQVGGIRQLAAKYSYLDTNRIGVWGHSGGGFATAAAMFHYPDFFKVGIAESGNHDNRNYEDDWGERYIGLLTKNADGTDNYTAQANQVYAKNLKGKLMLVHGMMDDNVPPYNTLLVVDALQKANKDFDLVLFPNSAHGYGALSPYMMRRRWDYFVNNLLGAEPPKEYKLETKTDPRN